jgi:predicted nucleic-acid-binding protein
MIGVDTKILLRFHVADDAAQHAAAAAFFAARSERSPAYISLIVLVEFVWSLRRTYGYGWDDIHALLGALTTARDIRLECQDVVVDALSIAIETSSGLVDNIVALANRADGCASTVTFDEAAARRIPSMELLS